MESMSSAITRETRFGSEGYGLSDPQSRNSSRDPNLTTEIDDSAGRLRPADFLMVMSLVQKLDFPGRTGVIALNYGLNTLTSPAALGSGLSFFVGVMRVNNGSRDVWFLEPPLTSEGKLADFVAFKRLCTQRHTARGGQVDEAASLESHYRTILLELRALTHPILSNHPNIVRILQVFWEADMDRYDQGWPVLVTEYAEEGSLAEYQSVNRIDFKAKMALMLDVVSGLEALHICGIVHGDIKSENILIFRRAGGVLAKLGDFGCAVTDLDEGEVTLPAFSPPWNAPEYRQRMPRDRLTCTDVYSFGLLVVRTLSNAQNPFKLLIAGTAGNTVRTTPTTAPPGTTTATWNAQNFLQKCERLKRLPNFMNLCLDMLSSTQGLDNDASVLVELIISFTLQLEPVSRDLGVAANVLREFLDRRPVHAPVEESASHLKNLSLDNIDYKEIDLSISRVGLRHPQCVQYSVIRALKAMSLRDTPSGTSNQMTAGECEASIELFDYYLHGNGGDEDYCANKALETMERIVQYGPSEIVVHGYRMLLLQMYDICNKSPASVFPVEDWLEEGVVLGGIYSRIKLTERDNGSIYKRILQKVRREAYVDMLDDNSPLRQIFTESPGDIPIKGIFEPGIQLEEFFLEEDDMSLLHYAATVGSMEVVQFLVERDHITDINCFDSFGRTALLIAASQGNVGICRYLMQRGASAKLASPTGETVLHWLVSFDDNDISELIELIMNSGADIEAWSEPGPAQGIDHTVTGTPLHRAVAFRKLIVVRELLKHGADPLYSEDGDPGACAFILAVRFSLAEIIREIFVQRPGFDIASQQVLFPNNLIEQAMAWNLSVYCLNLHGKNYQDALRDTADILLKRGVHADVVITSSTSQSTSGRTILHTAVACRCTSLTQFLLSDRAFCNRYINRAEEGEGVVRTPMQIAIQDQSRKMFDLLLAYGVGRDPSLLNWCSIVGHRNEYFIRNLIAAGWPLDYRDEDGCGAFEVAVCQGCFEFADILLQNGAKIDTFHKGGSTFGRILSICNIPISRIRYLLEPESRPYSTACKASFLCWPDMHRNVFHAVSSRDAQLTDDTSTSQLVSYLLQHFGSKQEIDALDMSGIPALGVAAILGHEVVVARLLEAGADPNAGAITPLSSMRHFCRNWSAGLPSTGSSVDRHSEKIRERYIRIDELLVSYGGQAPQMFGIEGIPALDFRVVLGQALRHPQLRLQHLPNDMLKTFRKLTGNHQPEFGVFRPGIVDRARVNQETQAGLVNIFKTNAIPHIFGKRNLRPWRS